MDRSYLKSAENIITAAYLTGAAEALKKSLTIGHDDIEKNLEDLKPLRSRFLNRAESDGYKDPVSHIHAAKYNAYQLLKTTTQFPKEQFSLAKDLQPSVQNPSVQNQNPSVQNPSVQNPSVQNPSVQNPSMQNPSVQNQNPSMQNPSVENPSVQNPSVQNPSMQNPSVQNPSVQNPSMQNQNPSVQNPSMQNPSVQNPSMQNPNEVISMGQLNTQANKIPSFEQNPSIGELPPTIESSLTNQEKLPTVVQLGGAKKKTHKRKNNRRKSARGNHK